MSKTLLIIAIKDIILASFLRQPYNNVSSYYMKQGKFKNILLRLDVCLI